MHVLEGGCERMSLEGEGFKSMKQGLRGSTFFYATSTSSISLINYHSVDSLNRLGASDCQLTKASFWSELQKDLHHQYVWRGWFRGQEDGSRSSGLKA